GGDRFRALRLARAAGGRHEHASRSAVRRDHVPADGNRARRARQVALRGAVGLHRTRRPARHDAFPPGAGPGAEAVRGLVAFALGTALAALAGLTAGGPQSSPRSEEHTSEL